MVLKENQPLTLDAVRLSFADPATPRQRVVESARHGDREERRTLELSQELVPYLAAPARQTEPPTEPPTKGEDPPGEWPGLTHVAHVVREVEYVSGKRAGEMTREDAYALVRWVRGAPTPSAVLAVWRGHWQIENGLHYRRDVTCGEDACTVRMGAAPAMLAALRNTVLGLVEPLLRQERFPNLPAAQRRFAMHPPEALALLGITVPKME